MHAQCICIPTSASSVAGLRRRLRLLRARARACAIFNARCVAMVCSYAVRRVEGSFRGASRGHPGDRPQQQQQFLPSKTLNMSPPRELHTLTHTQHACIYVCVHVQCVCRRNSLSGLAHFYYHSGQGPKIRRRRGGSSFFFLLIFSVNARGNYEFCVGGGWKYYVHRETIK